MSVVLHTQQQINPAIRQATIPIGTPIVGVLIANSQLIDNENCRPGLTRKVRRFIIQNMDNDIRFIRFCTSALSPALCGAPTVAPRVDLGIQYQLQNFQTLIIEPEHQGDDIVKMLSVLAAARRLGAYIPVGPIITGILVTVDYYDDLTT